LTDPVAFLVAEFGRIEELARAAGGSTWVLAEDWESVAIYDGQCEPVVFDEGWPSEGQKVHIAEHDPASVLRRVKADRQILAEHADDGGDCRMCCEAGMSEYVHDYGVVETRGAVDYPCRTVRLLAEAWGWEDTGIIWQVFNAHGRSYLAKGSTKAEAIENARPLFASNFLYDPTSRNGRPNPEFAFVGMRAIRHTA
jgi:hypothetical protein